MKRAHSLLDNNPKITLKELASLFGYCDEYHFCKVYKKYFGHTPKYNKYNQRRIVFRSDG